MLEFVAIPGFEEYEVNCVGDIRRRISGGNWPTGRLLKPAVSDTGHLYVMLSKNNKSKKMYVHRAVLLTFVGQPTSEKHLGLHKDDIPNNNNKENLYWGTKKDNHEDRMKNKGWDRSNNVKGNSHPNSKLTENDVLEIRIRRLNGERGTDLAKKFNISASTLCLAFKGRNWSHIK